MLGRVLLAVQPASLQRQIKELLSEDEGTYVDIIRGKQKLWERLGATPADMIVISESLFPTPVLETIEVCRNLPDSPTVVLVTENDSAEYHAALQAAGCSAVLLSTLPMHSIGPVLQTVLAERTQNREEEVLLSRIQSEPMLSDFVSTSPAMISFMNTVRRVLRSNSTLFFLGETGVGKERLARAIHNEGPRSSGPFIAVNCGAFPEGLLDSELFGHEKGSFTGATASRRGCFELAHGGTLFLDEVGEMPVHLQVKLLRVLQEREVLRVGAERPIKVDVRIMAATNRDIYKEATSGAFRQDLYYRLSVVTLTIPPLRNRHEDIAELVENYIHYLRPRISCEVYHIAPAALDALKQYDWPGNVRELINIIERAMLLAETRTIGLADLPQALYSHTSPNPLPSPADVESGLVLPDAWTKLPIKEVRNRLWETLEKQYLHKLLGECCGRIGDTATRAGIEPRSLYEKMKHYDLKKEDYKAERG